MGRSSRAGDLARRSPIEHNFPFLIPNQLYLRTKQAEFSQNFEKEAFIWSFEKLVRV